MLEHSKRILHQVRPPPIYGVSHKDLEQNVELKLESIHNELLQYLNMLNRSEYGFLFVRKLLIG